MLENLFAVSLSTTLPILLLYLISPILNRKYFSKLKYWIWLIISIRLMIPFRFDTERTFVKLPSIPSYQINVGDSNTYTETEKSAVPAELNKSQNQQIYFSEQNKIKSISLDELILYIWITGAMIFSMYHIATYIIFKRRIKNQCRLDYVYNTLHVYRCKDIKSPMLIGFLKPRILLPDINYNPAEYDIILKHEYIHYRRKDLWYKLILMIATALHWFNPTIYIMLKSAGRDLEYSCDDEVIKNSDLEYKKTYSLTILKTMKKHGGNEND